MNHVSRTDYEHFQTFTKCGNEISQLNKFKKMFKNPINSSNLFHYFRTNLASLKYIAHEFFLMGTM